MILLDEKSVSRQRLWQKKRIAEGKCSVCGTADLATSDMCRKCRDKYNKYKAERRQKAANVARNTTNGEN